VRAGERVVPLLLFTLTATRPVLLDQAHIAIPHRDLVVAIQTRPPPQSALTPAAATAATTAAAAAATAGPSVPLEELCAGAPRRLDASAVRRPLLAALLQTGWGVAPSHIGWSAAHNATATDLTWLVGRTPFGPYSARAELSFALRDAAARTPLHALAAEIIREARALRSFFREFRKEVAHRQTERRASSLPTTHDHSWPIMTTHGHS